MNKKEFKLYIKIKDNGELEGFFNKSPMLHIEESAIILELERILNELKKEYNKRKIEVVNKEY